MRATKSKKDNKKITFRTKVTLSTLAAVTGGTMAVTGNVHADTVNTQADTQTQTQNQQASDLKTQQDASRQAYADANKANTDAQSDLAQASAKNTTAQGNVDSAQADVQTATQNVQSATSKEQNTQAELTQAQSQADSAKSAYDNAVKQQAQTDQAVHQAQSDLKAANNAVSDAQKAADQANAKQSQAQANADTASQNVKDTTDQVQKVQGEVNDAQTSVNNAQNDVKNAENHDQVVAQDTNDVKTKTNAKNTADAKVNDAQKVSDEKSEAQNNAQTAVNNAQKTVDELSKSTSAEPVKESITVSPEWINLVKSIQNRLTSPSNTTDMDFTTEEGQEYVKLSNEIAKNAKYINDPTQAAISIHINNDGTLSKEDQIDATRFFLSLVNPIRKAAGMSELHMTNQSLEVGTAVAHQYNTDNWNVFPYIIQNGMPSYDMNNPHLEEHDTNAIYKNGAANEALTGGMYTVEYTVPNDPISDAKDVVYNKDWATNRDQLHEQLYKDVIGFLFQDGSNPGHAKILLGMHTQNANITGTNNASVQFDKYNQLHFNVEDKADTSTEIPVETSSQTDDRAAQLASAKQTLQDAQAKLKTATSEASQASADLASAQADAQHAANELKAAQDKLAHDTQSSMSLADAQAALKNAKAVLAQKQANLADAKKAAQKAQTMKSQSDSALASAKQETQAAQKTLANAQAKAKSAQEHVDALTNGDQAVADAKDKLNAANQKLQVAKSNHDTATDNLTKAQNELKQAQTKLENAKNEATKAAQALTDAQTKAANAKDALAKAKDGLITDNKVYGDSVAIKDQTIHVNETSKIVDPEIANPMAADPTQSLVMGAFLQMAASKLDTIPTGTTAKWNQPQNVSRDANLVGDHSEDVLVTFPDGSTTTVKMNLHVLAAVKPSQPDTPVVNPGHDQPTTPSDPTDQPGHNVKPGDTTKPASKPSTEPSTTPSDKGQTIPDHKETSNNDRDVTVAPSAGNKTDGAQTDTAMTGQTNQVNGAQTVATNGDNNVTVKPIANEISNSKAAKRSDLNNGKLPQTGNAKSSIALGIATLIGMFGLAYDRRKD